jgi:hypothetical protein
MVLFINNGGLFMKKFLVFVSIIVVLLGFAGCKEKRAPAIDTVKTGLDAFAACNFETVDKCFEETRFSETVEVNEKKILFLKQFSYKIISVNEDGKTATATVELSNVDVNAVFDEVANKGVDYLVDSAFLPEDERPTDEEIEKKSNELLIETIENENCAKKISTHEISMVYVDGFWKMQATDEIIDAICGGGLK